MKIIGLILASFLSSAALGQITIIQNGVVYSCFPQVEPGGERACVDKAYSGPFSKSEAQQLCKGSQSVGPADCGLKAYAGPFSKSETMQLCTGAFSVGPADCATSAYAGPFSKDESLRLCGKYSSISNAECAKKAYAGPYTKEESIAMCQSNPRLALNTLSLLQSSAEAVEIAEALKSMKLSEDSKLQKIKIFESQKIQLLKTLNK